MDRRRALEERRTSLDLPALKTDFLNEILTNLMGVVEAVPNAQKAPSPVTPGEGAYQGPVHV
ncbi:MAG: hypothetical protein GY838_02170 [bacterium]|nr:hypothetical protein [bacterium]